MPEGDTYEDNVYTRYLREALNIQNEMCSRRVRSSILPM